MKESIYRLRGIPLISFIGILLSTILFSCSKIAPSWPPQEELYPLVIIASVLESGHRDLNRYHLILHQEIAGFISRKKERMESENSSGYGSLKHFNWFLNKSALTRFWSGMEAAASDESGVVTQEELGRLLDQLFGEEGTRRYVLIVKLSYEDKTDIRKHVLTGYRVIHTPGGEVLSSGFSTDLPQDRSQLSPALGRLLPQLVETMDHTIPGLSRLSFIRIPRGCFVTSSYGTPEEECLDSFYLGRYPVTRSQWDHVMGIKRNSEEGTQEYPAVQVSWNQVQLFIDRLNGLSGCRYRLPTHLEWEYACRGASSDFRYGTQTGELSGDLANYADPDRRSVGLKSTGSHAPTPLGLYDMSGNVWEWTSDEYTGKTGPGFLKRIFGTFFSDSGLRIIKGGSYDSHQEELRCGNIASAPLITGNADIGFRLICE